MSQWDYCFHPLNKDVKAPTLFRDGVGKAKMYRPRREIFDFPSSEPGAFHASATCLWDVARSYPDRPQRGHVRDHRSITAATGIPDKMYGVDGGNIPDRSLSIPNEKDKRES